MANGQFVIYKASAGAGKTYTLVKEYLKMVFEGGEERLVANFKSVLAITFTNKASAEMKGRIMRELEMLATKPIDPQGHGMGADLLRELAAEWPQRHGGKTLDGGQLGRMAAHLYSIALHSYSDMSVSTIDSFTHRVVRTFAHDLGQPMNFNVVVEQQEMTNQAVAQLMSLVGTSGNEALTTLLAHFAEDEMADGSNYKVDKLIADLAGQLFKEGATEYLEGLSRWSAADFLALHADYVGLLQAVRKELAQLGNQMLMLLHGVGMDEFVCKGKSRGYYGYIGKLAEGQEVEPSESVERDISEGRLVDAKQPEEVKRAAENIAPRLQELFAQVKPLLVKIRTYARLLDKYYSAAVLGSLDEQMHLYATDNEIVHLSDFNKLINRVVEDEDNPAPFIYERLGNRYRHFLIDEFQDTSILQWHNLVPLLENGISQGCMSMVVGDGKQSIYRFRAGDVRQFVRLPQVEGMRHHGGVLSMEGNSRVAHLDANYRSAGQIVDFNNEFFSYIARAMYAHNLLVQDIYIGRTATGDLRPEGEEELRQKTVKGQHGYVKVELVSKATAEEEDYDSVWEAICGRVLATIRHLVDQRGYAYKDIAVLTRGNNELAQMGNYLMQEGGIPQTSLISFRLKESCAVMAVVAVMRMIVDRDDRVAEADLLHRLAALGIVSHEAMRRAGEGWASIARSDKSGERVGQRVLAEVGIKLNLDYLSALGLYDCCEEIVRMLHIDGIEVAYIASLLDEVAAFGRNYRHGLADFLAWFDQKDDIAASMSEGIDAVQMLTIHKAKGLGKPVVICPIKSSRGHGVSMWVDKERSAAYDVIKNELPSGRGELPPAYISLTAKEHTLFDPLCDQERMMSEVDELNVLYVAFTRPQERLYVFSPDQADRKTPSESDRHYPALLASYAPQGYEAGDETIMHTQEEGTDGLKPAMPINRLAFPDWSEKVCVASPAEKAITQVMEEKKRFGTYAHSLLSNVHSEGDIEVALEMLVRKGEIPESDRLAIKEIVQRAVSHPDAARFFDPRKKIKNECELVVDGKCLRPDRLVLLDDETWVVDFKTGAPHPDHHRQVAEYCAAVERMHFPNVRGYLMYLQPEVYVEQCQR